MIFYVNQGILTLKYESRKYEHFIFFGNSLISVKSIDN